MAEPRKIWINISIANLCIVAGLGVLMRSKMIFDLPWIDYNRLVDTHGHFAFSGWVTLALLTLMIYELPGNFFRKRIYQLLLGAVFVCSWATILSAPFESMKSVSETVSIIYIIVSYIFTAVFIKDIAKSPASRTIKLLSISALVYWVVSSIGPLMLAYLFSVKSLNAVLYRDALFGYLHLQYNGFFTLAVFALIYNKVVSNTNWRARKSVHNFAVLLCWSIIPSLFLTFMWYQTTVFYILSAIGALLLLACLFYFMYSAPLLIKEYKMIKPAIRYMAVLSISAFLIKIFLQSLTFINKINILVFGNRPMIMCFLHLVFLGFVTLFIISYYAQKNWLNSKIGFTRIALAVFTVAIVINETLLMVQGLGAMFIAGNPLFAWYLWGAGILLLAGALMIAVARIKTSKIN